MWAGAIHSRPPNPGFMNYLDQQDDQILRRAIDEDEEDNEDEEDDDPWGDWEDDDD